MSNSPLIGYTKLSPHCSSPRNHAIDTISIHCMAGNLSVETCGAVFQEKEASSNYGIGSDGRIALYVDEGDRSWCTSSASNDNRAITIEVANTVAADPWPVSDKAYASLINLLVDICKRNGIKKLLWKGDKNLIGQVDKQNMTVHRWFAAKACPGDWLYERHGQIADEVNKRLGASTESAETVLYRVQVGAFQGKDNAVAMLEKVKKAGFDTFMVKVDGLYKIQIGAYSKKSNAENMLKKVEAAGLFGFITTKSGVAVSVEDEIEVGSYVRVEGGAKTYEGESLASFVYNRTHKVSQIEGDRAVITYGGTVVAAVKLSDLYLV